MSQKDSLSALAAAAKKTGPRPTKKVVARGPVRLPGSRAKKSQTPLYLAIAGLGVVVLAGIVLAIVMLGGGSETKAKKAAENQGPPPEGPGALFRDVKAK